MLAIAFAPAASATPAGPVVVPTAVSAPVGSIPCAEGEMCFWEKPNYGGQIFELRTEDSTFRNNPCEDCVSSAHPGSNGTWSDQFSSYYNVSGRDYCMYFDVNYSGRQVRINDRQYGNLTGPLNDQTSSSKPC